MIGDMIPSNQPERSSSYEVLLDSREPLEIHALLYKICKKLKLTLRVKRLPIGDIQFLDLVIERKCMRDFFHSLYSARIWKQMRELKSVNGILVIHGSFPQNLPNDAIKKFFGFMASTHLKWNLTCVWFVSDASLEKYLTALFIKKLQEAKGLKSTIPYTKKSKEIPEILENILVQIPSIGIKTARRLLNRFNTITQVFNAGDDELLEVLNRTQLKSLRSILQAKYQDFRTDH